MLLTDSAKNSALRSRLLDLACILAIVLAISRVFYCEMDAGKSFSKMNLLATVDRWQAPELDKPIAIGDDPSASLEHIPNELYCANQSATGCIPLWNNLSGGGRPFVAEFQTLNWSVLRTLFPFSNKNAYEMSLLFKLLVAGLGTYFLCRRLRITALSSLAAAFAFMLCGRNLQWLELCNNYFLFPWLNLCFLWMASKPGFVRTVLCGVTVAACAYNMHPESFFCGVLAATLIAYDEFVASAKRAGVSDSLALRNWVLSVAGVGLLSIFLTAPLLLPFVEFIANSASYKFEDAAIAFINWRDYIADLCLPVSQIPYFCGTALGVLLPLGAALLWKNHRALVFCFLLNLIFCIRPGPLESIFSAKPFVFMLAEYPLATVVLLQAVCGAAGLDELNKPDLPKRLRSICLLPILLISVLVLLGQTQFGCKLICMVSDCAYAAPNLPITLLVTAGLTLALIYIWHQFRPLFLVLLVALNCWTLAEALSYFKMDRAEKPLQYRAIGDLKFVQEKGARMVATGYDAFQPNTNLVYGIDDFRAFAPIHPRRYKQFTDLAGFTSKFCFIQNCPYEMNHLFDIAGIKYILSERCPVKPALGPAHMALQSYRSPVKLADGLRFEQAETSYDSANDCVIAKTTFTLAPGTEARYSCRFVLTDVNSSVIYSGKWNFDSIDQEGTKLSKHRYQLSANLPLPQNYPNTRVYVHIMIRDNWNGTTLKFPFESASAIALPNAFLAGDCRYGRSAGDCRYGRSAGDCRYGRSAGGSPASNSGADLISGVESDRFVQIRQNARDGFYLYENKKALPPAYLVHAVKIVDGEAQSLAALSDNKFDWQNSAVVERDIAAVVADRSRRAAGAPAVAAGSAEFARVLDKDADSVLIFCNSNSPAHLVLTDNFYPGWVACIDGNPTPVYAANHAFRAVALEPGRHAVLFKFEPRSFALGVTLLQIGLAASLAGLIAGVIMELRDARKQNGETAQAANQQASQVS